MTELAITPPTPIAPRSNHVVALNEGDMQLAQGRVKEYLEEQAALTSAELAETREAFETAVLAGWKTTSLDNACRRLEKRQRYLVHLLAAVDAGFVIVPNMPMTVFAVRVKRQRPKHQTSRSEYSERSADLSLIDEKEQLLPQGEGRYVNPTQLVGREKLQIGTAEKPKQLYVTYAQEFDSIEFPMAAAQVHVMDATQRAMALKIFDRIGIVPETRPKGDPIILGQIVLKHSGAERVASCLIAWHLDLRTL